MKGLFVVGIVLSIVAAGLLVSTSASIIVEDAKAKSVDKATPRLSDAISNDRKSGSIIVHLENDKIAGTLDDLADKIQDKSDKATEEVKKVLADQTDRSVLPLFNPKEYEVK